MTSNEKRARASDKRIMATRLLREAVQDEQEAAREDAEKRAADRERDS